ncbi:unnamed protein product [Agarophyton chilense]|eukprot:gb/GEZJ01001131.1/.p2 GENE.gb/GEZJ01001131.1/~~gb/GEZJ01001131.1/.p2  ORF type:complete len:237 (-),score=41.93 gb/GEZJ01001131.1/:648-1358(-)
MCQSHSVHKIRKKFSKATTRESTIESNIAAPYVLEKKGLLREKAGLTKALQFLQSGKAAWEQVANIQKEFSEHILGECDVSSPVYSVVNNTANNVRGLNTELKTESSPDESFVILSRNVKAYIGELNDIEKDFVDVETSFTEMLRYEGKVEKLKSKKNPKMDKVNRNIDKMAVSRSVHESKVGAITERIRAVRSKYDGVLQATLHSFWLGQSKYMGLVEKRTDSIRQTALDHKDEM